MKRWMLGKPHSKESAVSRQFLRCLWPYFTLIGFSWSHPELYQCVLMKQRDSSYTQKTDHCSSCTTQYILRIEFTLMLQNLTVRVQLIILLSKRMLSISCTINWNELLTVINTNPRLSSSHCCRIKDSHLKGISELQRNRFFVLLGNEVASITNTLITVSVARNHTTILVMQLDLQRHSCTLRYQSYEPV